MPKEERRNTSHIFLIYQIPVFISKLNWELAVPPSSVINTSFSIVFVFAILEPLLKLYRFVIWIRIVYRIDSGKPATCTYFQLPQSSCMINMQRVSQFFAIEFLTVFNSMSSHRSHLQQKINGVFLHHGTFLSHLRLSPLVSKCINVLAFLQEKKPC